MATKRISSHLILHRYVLIENKSYLQFMMFSWMHINFLQNSSYTTLKKRGVPTLTRAVREYVNNLKEKQQVSMSHLDQLLMTLCSFFDLEPESTITNTTSSENLDATEHPLFLIVNGHHNTMVLFFIKFSKIQWNFHQTSKILNSLILYFDFWKLMDEGNFLNLKILNLILFKILKLIVEAFQNYFYKIKISKVPYMLPIWINQVFEWIISFIFFWNDFKHWRQR